MILRNVRRSRRLSNGTGKRGPAEKSSEDHDDQDTDDIDQLHQDIFGNNFM